jgi:hypothetical protein
MSDDGIHHISKDGINHYVSLMNLGKDKKKMAKKILYKILDSEDFPNDRDEAVFAEIFKLLVRTIKNNWTTESIEQTYHETFEKIQEEVEEGKITEQNLLTSGKNITQYLQHVRDELLEVCICGKIMINFEYDSFNLIIMPCGKNFKY